MIKQDARDGARAATAVGTGRERRGRRRGRRFLRAHPPFDALGRGATSSGWRRRPRSSSTARGRRSSPRAPSRSSTCASSARGGRDRLRRPRARPARCRGSCSATPRCSPACRPASTARAAEDTLCYRIEAERGRRSCSPARRAALRRPLAARASPTDLHVARPRAGAAIGRSAGGALLRATRRRVRAGDDDPRGRRSG